MTGACRWIAAIVLVFVSPIALSGGETAQPAADTVAILYPEVPEPERGLFELLRQGARTSIESAGARSAELAVGEGETQPDLANRVRESGATRILILGRRAYERSAGLERTYPAFAAAVDLPVGESSRVSGIAMYPDPGVVFATLHVLAPRIERVIIVVDRHSTEWMVKAATTVAREKRLDLVIHDAHSLAEGASHAWNILRYGNPDTDALWVLDSSGYATGDVLPQLVEESWERHFLVFSSVLQHVNQGALFAVYVDPKGLGRTAGTKVLQIKRGAHEIVFLQDLERAVNMRVAAHLELPISGTMANTFDLVLGRR